MFEVRLTIRWHGHVVTQPADPSSLLSQRPFSAFYWLLTSWYPGFPSPPWVIVWRHLAVQLICTMIYTVCRESEDITEGKNQNDYWIPIVLLYLFCYIAMWKIFSLHCLENKKRSEIISIYFKRKKTHMTRMSGHGHCDYFWSGE